MELIALDTSILLDYYRAKDKKQTRLYHLSLQYTFAIPTIVMYEVLRGDKQKDAFWELFFKELSILPFDTESAMVSATIYQHLVKQNQLIGVNDILIAGTSIANHLRLAYYQCKRFSPNT